MSFFDLGEFYKADFFTLLFAPLTVPIFGTGLFLTGHIIKQRMKEQA